MSEHVISIMTMLYQMFFSRRSPHTKMVSGALLCLLTGLLAAVDVVVGIEPAVPIAQSQPLSQGQYISNGSDHTKLVIPVAVTSIVKMCVPSASKMFIHH